MKKLLLALFALLPLTGLCVQTGQMAVEAEANRWWPIQAVPKALVRSTDYHGLPAPRGANQMLLQSVAGLAALAVNEGRGDEMVWIGSTSPDMEDWYARLLRRHPQWELRGTLDPWALVDRYVKRGVIKGYILYKYDKSPDKILGKPNKNAAGMDCSVNVATSLAGLLGGIIVDEQLQKVAEAHGLTLLLDARAKTQQWCFETYKDRFNRRLLCNQAPHKGACRDLAIAQKAFTVYGSDAPAEAALKWLEPLSPILGWNGGDEFKTTRMSTVQGHIQTATDWCLNLAVLMAGTEKRDAPKVRGFDPATIDWSDQRSAVSFINSDGDNVQWYESNFFHHPDGFWSNPDRGHIPFGWSSCFAHVRQLFPEAMDYACATQTTNDWFVEWGGGYYYPDLFALERPDRWGLLARHAQRTWALMQENNTRVIGFNVWKPGSPDALKAYEVFAGQTDGLLAILVFQYAPYEGAAGQVFWVQDRTGRDVPVITTRYSIWSLPKPRERSGSPAKIAREIRDTVDKTPPAEMPRFDWVIVHAWSYFRKIAGDDEYAENLTKDTDSTQGGVRGYTPALWCAERLPAAIRVISPDELIWRLRMKHNPEQTKQFLKQYQAQ